MPAVQFIDRSSITKAAAVIATAGGRAYRKQADEPSSARGLVACRF
jgi:hypothetical protein